MLSRTGMTSTAGTKTITPKFGLTLIANEEFTFITHMTKADIIVPIMRIPPSPIIILVIGYKLVLIPPAVRVLS
jgi:hypothetical protein